MANSAQVLQHKLDDVALGSGLHKVTKFTNCRVLVDGKLVSDEDVWVRDGRIIDPVSRFWEAADHSEFACDQIIDCGGAIISPGFLDIQMNGAFGVDFSDPAITEDDIKRVCAKLLEHGVTAICPTLVSSAPDTYAKCIATFRRLSQSRQEQHVASLADCNGRDPMAFQPGARVLGLHLEGPFINPENKGAHAGHNLLVPSAGMASLAATYGQIAWESGDVRILTLAPELEGALGTIHDLCAHGVVVAIGHTNSDIKTADAAVSAGATLITHLFNAMRAFHHRDPGVVGLLGRKHGSVGRGKKVPMSSGPSAAFQEHFFSLEGEPSTAPAVVAEVQQDCSETPAEPRQTASPLHVRIARQGSGLDDDISALLEVDETLDEELEQPHQLDVNAPPITAVGPFKKQAIFSIHALAPDATRYAEQGGDTAMMTSPGVVAADGPSSTLPAARSGKFHSTATTPFSPVPHRTPARRGPQDEADSASHARPFYSLIVDGVHNHPYAVTVAHETHPGGLILITDAIKAMGLPVGRHKLGELEVDIFHGLEDGHYEGLHAVVTGTSTLAGAVVPLDKCLRNLASFTKCSPAAALECVTSHPARCLHVEDILGSLKKDAWADLVLLDDGLAVLQTYLAGQLVWKREGGS